MAIAIKALGNNSFGTSTSAQELLTTYSGNTSPSNAYAVPVGKAVIVNNIRVANRDTVKRTVTVNYLPGGSNARAVSPAGLSIPPGGLAILDDELILIANDKLQVAAGETSGTALLDFVVGGIERDA